MGDLPQVLKTHILILKKETHQNLGLKHGEHLYSQTSSTRHDSVCNSDTCEMLPHVATLMCASKLSAGQEWGEKSCTWISNTIWFVKCIAPAWVFLLFSCIQKQEHKHPVLWQTSDLILPNWPQQIFSLQTCFSRVSPPSATVPKKAKFCFFTLFSDAFSHLPVYSWKNVQVY